MADTTTGRARVEQAAQAGGWTDVSLPTDEFGATYRKGDSETYVRFDSLGRVIHVRINGEYFLGSVRTGQAIAALGNTRAIRRDRYPLTWET